MSTRPLIGYATRSGVVCTGSAVKRFANNESYARAIAHNGGAPLMIPSLDDAETLDAAYAALDGLLLTGGPDVDPARYGHDRHPTTDNGDLPMEHAEVHLTRRALQDSMPILGICRGMQVLNVIAGGTLYQDIKDEIGGPIEHPAEVWDRDFLTHSVLVTPDSLLGRAVGHGHIGVNSLHHQAVRDLAPGYVITAEAPDGVKEAMERPDLPFVVAVQWHPEELYGLDERWNALFRAFVDAAATYRARRRRS